jgi:hypothetical protein
MTQERCAGCGLYPEEIDPKKECEAGGTLGHHMIDVDERGMAIGSVDAKRQEDTLCDRCGGTPCWYVNESGQVFCTRLCEIKHGLDPDGIFT